MANHSAVLFKTLEHMIYDQYPDANKMYPA